MEYEIFVVPIKPVTFERISHKLLKRAEKNMEEIQKKLISTHKLTG